jgi:hypothetical protein
MGIDIKIPIGLLFGLLGILLTIFGLITSSDQAIYVKSLNININLWVGMAMLAFGSFMLLSAKGLRKKKN